MIRTLILLVISLNLNLPGGEEVHRVCGSEGDPQILAGLVYLPARHFNETYLRKYFTRYLSYPETTEIDLLLYGDRKLEEQFSMIDDVLGIAPIKTKAPVARFRKIGRNAFFEFRDAGGKTHNRVLAGNDILSPVVGVFPAVLATQVYRPCGRDVTCDQVARELRVVLPLDKMNLDQVSAVCRAYGETLGSIPLDVKLFSSFPKAGWRNKDLFPSLRAMSEGYAEPERTRSADYWFHTRGGKGGVLVILDADRPMGHRIIEW